MENQAVATERTYIRKISAANVCGKIPNPPEKGVKPLLQVIGRASGYRTGEKDHGDGPKPWWGLTGVFEAINIETGEIFNAPECFLPEPFGSAIANQLKDGNAKSVDFAFELGIKDTDKNVRYEWVCKPLADPSESDPLDSLRGRVPGLQKALTDQSGDKSKGKK